MGSHSVRDRPRINRQRATTSERKPATSIALASVEVKARHMEPSSSVVCEAPNLRMFIDRSDYCGKPALTARFDVAQVPKRFRDSLLSFSQYLAAVSRSLNSVSGRSKSSHL